MRTDYPEVTCPQCGNRITDFDGVGFLFCPRCSYCTHPSVNGNVCGLCEKEVKRSGEDELMEKTSNAKPLRKSRTAPKELLLVRRFVRSAEQLQPHQIDAAVKYLADRFLGVKLWRT